MTKKILGEENNPILAQFTHGLDVDKLMYKEEILVQKHWCIQLSLNQYLSNDEVSKITNCLDEIEREIEEDLFLWQILDEDIHMNIERALTEKLGGLGKKIHLGRSRNDLVATTQRLFISNKSNEILSLISDLISVICKKSSENIDIIIPGLTHQQSGQPVRFAHIFLAHAHALKRDMKNIEVDIENSLSYLPLGAAAFSGTHLTLDLKSLADRLGFSKVLSNSYDAVGDRDFILGTLNSYSILAVHISRMCQEIIYNSSTNVGLIILPKNWTTGSSIMPNKRNPDTIEITRAKMARVISAGHEALSIVAAVVPSYGSDLHELKRTFLRSHLELKSSLEVMIPFIDEMQINQSAASSQLEKGHILATDFANRETLLNHGNFRESYLSTKKLVELADEKKCQIHELNSWPANITFESSVELRTLAGGTSRLSVLSQIESLRS